MDRSEQVVKRILIVDDDYGIRDSLTQIFEDEGYDVTSASNGEEAITLLRNHAVHPQVILLDLMMPIMNGWEFRSAQQQDPALATIPVVVISADRQLSQHASVLRANAYLAKPINFATLLDTVEQYCA